MAAPNLILEVATPERLLVRERVTEAQIPAADGYLGVLPEHAPLVAELGMGELTYTEVNGKRNSMVVLGGFLEIRNNHIRVLADRAERIDEIDVKRAETAVKRARQRLDLPGGQVDIARALNALKRAEARLAAAGVPLRGRGGTA
ncbi:MAG: ATP synthase F1 subunit epsilon [Acidobacteria bacterium]|nr:ATP synthase F1 subunit epsilon [Acidobacteriota bacterium]